MSLLLCDHEGRRLGALPPFEVEMPWWPEVEPVVAGAQARFGVEVTVLRLVAAPVAERAAGGPVSYLAEVAEPLPLPLAPWPADASDPLLDHPLRLPFARPGGPGRDLAWADLRLRAAGRDRVGPAVQVKTWNLSSVWRLPTVAGPAWLKVVPPFFGHEGAMLARLDPAVVPPLIAAEGPRVLLADVPGQDHWDGPLPVLLRVLGMLVRLQRDWVHRVHELAEVGAPDWRVGPFVPAVTELVARTAGELDDDTVAALQALLAGLPDRFAAVASCGVPDTLVHGDFHPGNTRGSVDGHSVLLDWGLRHRQPNAGPGRVPLQHRRAEARAGPGGVGEPVARRGAGVGPGPGGRAAGAGRCAPAGADLPDLPGRHRAGRAGLPRERPGHLAAPGRAAQLTPTRPSGWTSSAVDHPLHGFWVAVALYVHAG